MSLHIWILYVGAVFLISGTPGPNMLLAMTHGIHHGVEKTATSTMAGLLLGVFVILMVSLGGLGAVLLASSRLFEIIKYVGAAYLIYLGIRTWLSTSTQLNTEGRPDADSALARFRIGIIVALSNPKAILFGVAFFPQFIDPAKPIFEQGTILVLTFAFIETSWMFVYAGGGAKLAQWLRKGRRMHWFDRAAGSAFIGAGLVLGSFRR